MGPKQARSTVLTVEEEAPIIAFRRHTLSPLDDCLYALQDTIPNLRTQAESLLRVSEQLSYTAGTAKATYVLETIFAHAGEAVGAIQHTLRSIALWRER